MDCFVHQLHYETNAHGWRVTRTAEKQLYLHSPSLTVKFMDRIIIVFSAKTAKIINNGSEYLLMSSVL